MHASCWNHCSAHARVVRALGTACRARCAPCETHEGARTSRQHAATVPELLRCSSLMAGKRSHGSGAAQTLMHHVASVQ